MRLTRTLIAAATTAVIVGGAALPAAADTNSAQDQVVSAVPADYTPNVNEGTVFSIGQSGSTVVIGGMFDSVSPPKPSTTYPVDNIAAFTAGTGTIITSFAPTLNGKVTAIAAGPTPGTVYVGGYFTQIDGVNSHIALLNASTGAIVPGWKSPTMNGSVNTLVVSGNQLFVGGWFTKIAGAAKVGLAVLDPTTGKLDDYATPAFVGHHNYGVNCDPTVTHCAKAGTGIRAMDVSPDGTRLIAIGDFTSVDGLARDQIAMIDLGSSAASVDQDWATARYTARCSAAHFDSYMRGVQFSPDGSYFVSVATGGSGGVNSDGTKQNCDAALRFETNATGSDVAPTWIDSTGHDTFLSVAITGTAIYVGGHQRWVNNSNGPNLAAEGAVPRPGIVALDPINGMPLAWNPGRNPRGAGAYALLATSDGLYVGSDTTYVGNFRYLRKRIVFFPLAGGYPLGDNQIGSLPGTIYLLGGGANPSAAQPLTWDGLAVPSLLGTLSDVDWSTVRGAFEVGDEVYYGSTDGNFYQRSFDGATFGPAVAIDPYDDPAWANVQTGSGQTYRGVKSAFYSSIPSLTSMFYSAGRLYYTLAGKTHMFWRWFEPDSGVIGADQFQTTDSNDWSKNAGAFLSGSTLYFVNSTSGSLRQVGFSNGQPTGTPTIANSTIDWRSHGAFIQAPTTILNPTAHVVGGGMGFTVRTAPRLRGPHAARKRESVSLGRWSPAPTAYRFRWYVGHSRIPGATKQSIRLRHAQIGKRVWCRVVATRPGYQGVIATSNRARVGH